jgi:hypothetical protein
MHLQALKQLVIGCGQILFVYYFSFRLLIRVNNTILFVG